MLMLRITIVSILLSLGSLFFTNCSDVNFSQKGESPLAVGATGCTGTDCTPGGGGGNGGNSGNSGNSGNGNDVDDDPGGIIPDGGGGDGGSATPRVVGYPLNAQAPVKSNKLDVLLIIDNSGSMEEDRKHLATKLAGFTSQLTASGVDWQMCHYTTQVYYATFLGWKYRPKHAIKWSDLGLFVLKPNSSSNIDSIFRNSLNNIKDGNAYDGSSSEYGIASTYQLILEDYNSDCFREGAAKAAIVLTDEDEGSKGRDTGLGFKSEPQNLMALVRDRFGAETPFTFHSLIIRSGDKQCFNQQQDPENDIYSRYGKVYEELSTDTGGVIGDICSSNYSNQLQDVKDRIDYTLDAISLNCEPIEGSLILNVNGAPSNAYTVVGNKVIFSPSLVEGTLVTGSYNCLEGP